MPQKINIQGLQDINDPFYRYQMDKFILVKEKNKLVINNFDKVCQDIKRSPNYFANQCWFLVVDIFHIKHKYQ